MRSQTKREYADRLKMAIEPMMSGEVETRDVGQLADRAAFSRFHFQRLFKVVMGETPGELRRRLQMERAAWRLRNTAVSVTEIAIDAEYASLEGFIRGFRKAYGLSPSRFRRVPEYGHLLPSENGVHYQPVANISLRAFMQGEFQMDLVDRLIDHDLWLTRQMLLAARRLTDEQLDLPLKSESQAVGFEPEQKTLRELLDRIILAKEVWVAATEHQGFPEERSKTPEGMIARFEVAYPMFVGLAKKVRDQGQWDATFVDELCEPPETFSFGGMIAHVLTFGIHRRQLALEIMRKMGIEELGYGDPISWERELGAP